MSRALGLATLGVALNVGGGGTSYQQLVLGLLGPSVISYWPLWDASGTTADDIDPNNYNATYTGGTLASTTSPVGKPCPSFTSPVGGVNISAARAAFDGDEGSFGVTIKADNLAMWTGAVTDYILRIAADAANYIIIQRPPNEPYIQASRLVSASRL